MKTTSWLLSLFFTVYVLASPVKQKETSRALEDMNLVNSRNDLEISEKRTPVDADELVGNLWNSAVEGDEEST
ncbi:hypothetical protein F4815DRAFT_450810 [Daldinia loculata]|nr:hypothetical protein F4815DRAFT_450810 [Daldinia loculata]